MTKKQSIEKFAGLVIVLGLFLTSQQFPKGTLVLSEEVKHLEVKNLTFVADNGKKNSLKMVSDGGSDRLAILDDKNNYGYSFEVDYHDNSQLNLFNYREGDTILRWFRIVDGKQLDFPWILGEDRIVPGFDQDLFVARDQLWCNMRWKLDGTVLIGKEYAGGATRLHPVEISPEGSLKVQDSKKNVVLSADTKSGKTGVGTAQPETKLDINNAPNTPALRMRSKFTPESLKDPAGKPGDMAWDNDYLYIKTDDGWKRVRLVVF